MEKTLGFRLRTRSDGWVLSHQFLLEKGLAMRLSVVFRALTFVAALSVVGFTPAAASQKPVTNAASVTKTFVIEAIDQAKRLVTLRDDAGISETIECGPRYSVSMPLKWATRSPLPTPSPSCTKSTRLARRRRPERESFARPVTGQVAPFLKADYDGHRQRHRPKVPSITVTTLDGRKMAFTGRIRRTSRE